MRLRLRVVLLSVAGIALGLLVATRPPSRRPGEAPATPPRAPREFRGVCLAGGLPAAGARVRLIEAAGEESGEVASVECGADGAFRIAWRPRATDRLDRLTLLFSAEGRGLLSLPAAGLPSAVEIPEAAACEGRVVDGVGRPIEGASIACALRGSPVGLVEARSGADGRFLLEGISRGAPLRILVRKEGFVARVESGFRGGDPVTARLYPAKELRFLVVDPSGEPIEGAAIRLDGPSELAARMPAAVSGAGGRARLGEASAGARVFVEARARGHLGALFAAAPHAPAMLRLLPAREVSLKAWDALSRAGLSLDRLYDESVDLHGEGAAWRTTPQSAIQSLYELRPEGESGAYRLLLPRCPLRLSLEARGYHPGEISLGARETEASIPMAPAYGGASGILLLRPEPPPGARIGAFFAAIVDEEGGWHSVVEVPPGGAEVEGRGGAKLQAGSIGARDGFWAPPQPLPDPGPGRKSTVALAFRPAVRITVRATGPDGAPIERGTARIHDLLQERLGRPLEAPLLDGSATLWARPARRVRIEVEGPDDCFPHVEEFDAGREPVVVEARLARAAALRLRVRDPGGNAVPFAEAHLFGPVPEGRDPLESRPRRLVADAGGLLRSGPVGEGAAALEVRAPGFRAARLPRLRADPGAPSGTADLSLEPARTVRGRLLDRSGAPLPGVWVRALPADFERLPAPGGSLFVYDLGSFTTGAAASGEEGTFEVPDESAGEAVLAILDDRGPFAVPLEEGADVTVPPVATLYLDELPGSVQGVYVILARGHAVRVQSDPPMALRPLPVPLRAGPQRIFVLLRSREWALADVDLAPEETRVVSLRFRRD